MYQGYYENGLVNPKILLYFNFLGKLYFSLTQYIQTTDFPHCIPPSSPKLPSTADCFPCFYRNSRHSRDDSQTREHKILENKAKALLLRLEKATLYEEKDPKSEKGSEICQFPLLRVPQRHQTNSLNIYLGNSLVLKSRRESLLCCAVNFINKLF